MDRRLASLHAEAVSGEVPRHVAIVMDGNGRWALEQGRERLEGHREGAESVRAVTRTARRVGCEALTLYAFSAQNWRRPPDEVAGLMDLLREYLEGERDELLDNDVRLSAVGELDRLPSHVREPLDELREATAHCEQMVLTLCLSYGGREELVAMARQVAERVARGELDPGSVDEAAVRKALWTGELPEVDLMIRTSGEMRISNYLLWGLAYAELLFTETPWPLFREEAFLQAVLAYQARDRRFGRTASQLADDSDL